MHAQTNLPQSYYLNISSSNLLFERRNEVQAKKNLAILFLSNEVISVSVEKTFVLEKGLYALKHKLVSSWPLWNVSNSSAHV